MHLIPLTTTTTTTTSSSIKNMKDRMERLVVLPFAAGCVSTSSISVCPQQPTGTRRVPKHNTISLSPTGIKEQEDTLSSESMRNSFRFLALPKPNISIGLQRLSKSLKSFSHLFVFKEEMQEVEVEMEIGHPTDVKHVTHIGLDGSATTTNCWNNYDPLNMNRLITRIRSEEEEEDGSV